MYLGIFEYLPEEMHVLIYKNVFRTCLEKIGKYPCPYITSMNLKTKDLIDFSDLKLHEICQKLKYKYLRECIDNNYKQSTSVRPIFWPSTIPIYMRFYRKLITGCNLENNTLQEYLEIPKCTNGIKFNLRLFKIEKHKISFYINYQKDNLKLNLEISINYDKNDDHRFNPQKWKFDNYIFTENKQKKKLNKFNLRNIENKIEYYNCRISTSGTIFWSRLIESDVNYFYSIVLNPEEVVWEHIFHKQSTDLKGQTTTTNST